MKGSEVVGTSELASVWVFLTKSNAKIAIGCAELTSSVTTQKKCLICDDFVLA